MQEQYVAEERQEEKDLREELSVLLEKAEQASEEYADLEQQLAAVESEYDAAMEKLNNESIRKASEFYEQRSLLKLSPTANRPARRKLNELHSQARNAHQEMGKTQKLYQSVEKSLFDRIRKNTDSIAVKQISAYRSLGTDNQKGSSNASKRNIEAKRERLDRHVAIFEASIDKINANLRKQIEENRTRYDRKRVNLVKSMRYINEQIDQLLADDLAERASSVGSDDPMENFGLAMDRYASEIAGLRANFNDNSKKLRDEMAARQREIRFNINKAESTQRDYEVERRDRQDGHEMALLYVKVIGWVLSVAMLIATVFVFSGSRKIGGQTPSAY